MLADNPYMKNIHIFRWRNPNYFKCHKCRNQMA